MLSRRRFLQLAGGSVAASATAGLYAWRVEPHWVEFVRRPLRIRRLPRRLAGRMLVQISDIHVGPRVDDEYIVSTFDRITALQPDIVVLTGDLISYHATTFDQLAGVIPHLPKGRIDSLAIPGNHDYGPAWSHPEIAEGVSKVLQAHGVTVLRNRIANVEGLQVAGLDDLWGTAFDPAPVLASLHKQEPALVLSHNPDVADLPIWGDYAGWILSGHTHGGQCKPPFLPPPLLPVRNRRYTAGEFELPGGRRMYINRGIGHLLEVRFNVRPEVTIFDLREA